MPFLVSAASSPTAGMHHYHARSYQLAWRGVPKRACLDRHYQTVGSTTLWGSGGWTFSKCLVALLESQELSFLRRILQVPCLPGEGFVEYVKRSARVCRQVLVKYRLQGIVATALTRLHGWAGHLARLPPSSPVVRVLRFRSLTWWREQLERGNRKDSRHHRLGRFARWEAPLELFGPEWFTLAQDRSAWRLSRSRVVLGELLRLGAHKAFGFGGRSANALFPPSGGGPPSDLTVPWPPTSLLGNPASMGDLPRSGRPTVCLALCRVSRCPAWARPLLYSLLYLVISSPRTPWSWPCFPCSRASALRSLIRSPRCPTACCLIIRRFPASVRVASWRKMLV